MLLYASVQHARKHKNTRCILLPIHNDIDYGLYQDLLDFGTSGEIIVMDFCNPCDIRDLYAWKEFFNEHRTDDALIVQTVRNLEKPETARCRIVFKSSDGE